MPNDDEEISPPKNNITQPNLRCWMDFSQPMDINRNQLDFHLTVPFWFITIPFPFRIINHGKMQTYLQVFNLKKKKLTWNVSKFPISNTKMYAFTFLNPNGLPLFHSANESTGNRLCKNIICKHNFSIRCGKFCCINKCSAPHWNDLQF